MRKIATAAATALILAFAPASAAIAQSPAESASSPVATASVPLAQEEDDGGGNAGLWGLLGLLGLLGLIPRGRKRETEATGYRGRSTGM